MTAALRLGDRVHWTAAGGARAGELVGYRDGVEHRRLWVRLDDGSCCWIDEPACRQAARAVAEPAPTPRYEDHPRAA